MQTWRQALPALIARQQPAILITVASILGSSPRDTGAKMLITREQQFDTIGGGHLEWRAIQIARGMLQQPAQELGAQRRLERFPLAASLGQCCGGLIHLAFERIDAASAGYCAVLASQWQQQRDCWRLVPLDQPQPVLVCDRDGTRLNRDAAPLAAAPDFQRDACCHIMTDAGGAHWLVDPCLAERAHLYLFGAGHVGSALVRLLADLPCRVTWVDEREELFPATPPANVTLEATDTPQAVIDAAPPDSYFLVMTHSHPLDQDLSERILRRDDAHWFGLIGSKSKRLQFERRLRRHGISEHQLARMVCPVGLPDIPGKAPAIIAIGIAAQLLKLWGDAGVQQRHSQPAASMQVL